MLSYDEHVPIAYTAFCNFKKGKTCIVSRSGAGSSKICDPDQTCCGGTPCNLYKTGASQKFCSAKTNCVLNNRTPCRRFDTGPGIHAQNSEEASLQQENIQSVGAHCNQRARICHRSRITLKMRMLRMFPTTTIDAKKKT